MDLTWDPSNKVKETISEKGTGLLQKDEVRAAHVITKRKMST